MVVHQQTRALGVYLGLKEAFVIAALMARSLSRSYRIFRVGAVVLAENDRGEWATFSGSNIKRKGKTKACAERLAIRRARAAGFRKIIAVCVAGDYQADDDSGVHSQTLHPCQPCRRFFVRLGSDMPGDTIILTVNPEDPRVREEQLLRDLLNRHKHENGLA